MGFSNVYEDEDRARSYARLEFPGTYYLAYRDLPLLIGEGRSGAALDFGCGAGRSTRFLRRNGLTATGVDISPEMLMMAREIDPAGDYRLIGDCDLSTLEPGAYGIILSAFTFDNIPTRDKKLRALKGLRELLTRDGRMLNLVSSPEIYKHEWASFTTKDYPENLSARTGDEVRIVMTDVEDRRPVVDVIWYDEDYRSLYSEAGLKVVHSHGPLGKAEEPYTWVTETKIAPWTIYVLERDDGRR
jgi:SAM-dependent methyltransferase